MGEHKDGLPVILFADVDAFDRWLSAQGPNASGVWVKFAKTASGLASISKSDAIDVALCHGWIDGQLQKYDDRHWLTRFTPRRPRSKWSQINRSRAIALVAQGRMTPTGQREIDAAQADGRWDAAYAPASRAELPEDWDRALEQSPCARANFDTLNSANRYAFLYRLASAKRPATRVRKIAELIAKLERGEAFHG